MYWEVLENHIQGAKKAGKIYPLAPAYGYNLVNKIAAFVFLTFISLIITLYPIALKGRVGIVLTHGTGWVGGSSDGQQQKVCLGCIRIRKL